MGKRYIAGLVLAAAVCLFVFFPGQSVYADVENPGGMTQYLVEIALDGASSISASNLFATITASVGNYRTSTNGSNSQRTYLRDVIYNIAFYNRRSYPVTINNSYIGFTLAPKNDNTNTDAKWQAYSFDYVSGELSPYRMSGNTVYLRPSTGYNLIGKIYVPANGFTLATFVVTYVFNANNPESVSSFNAVLTYPSGTVSISDASDLYPSYESYLMAVAEAMADQVQSSEDLDYQSEGTSQEVSSQHQQEQSYFDQSTDAMADTGLTNWHLDQDAAEGMSFAGDVFGRLWNALGPMSSVIVFILLMKFGTLILRHRGSGGGGSD